MYYGRLIDKLLDDMPVIQVLWLRSSPAMYRVHGHDNVNGMSVADLGTTVPAAFASLISACWAVISRGAG